MYFYAVSNYPVEDIQQLKDDQHEISLVKFRGNRQEDPLELKIWILLCQHRKCKDELGRGDAE
jgi:hypothetical protein